jgi:putative DNA primase/helicase
MWPHILPAIGISAIYLTGKNGPCPLCPYPGGRDRWRFLDTDGNGTWICSRCGSGSGADLVMRFRGLPFKDAADLIEGVIGNGDLQPCPARPRFDPRAGLQALWRGAKPIQPGDPTDMWLRHRGVGLEPYPSALRTGRRVRYTDNGTVHPAMLALVTGPDGKPATIHRTYLTPDGHKAQVEKPRKLYSEVVKGAAIRLTPPAPIMGIAEGIETALAAAKLFNVPTWAATCAGMLDCFEPPSEVTKLIVFADNDPSGAGEQAAMKLASRLARDRHGAAREITVSVHMPTAIGDDWNDVLLGCAL